MKIVYSDDHRLQHGRGELTDGRLVPCHDRPARADAVLEECRRRRLGEVVAPADHSLATVLQVHDEGLVAFLETAWDRWHAIHGDTDALPLSWRARGMGDTRPESIEGQLGYYCFDAGTPVTAGTWRAARAGAQVAETAALSLSGPDAVSFALTRPPGHHAGPDYYGGYCFLNFSAVAAQALLNAGASRVAVLDVDYHHGNGTQEIFYRRDDVLTVSLHGDPRYGFPFFLGHADESNEHHLNLPLPHGTAWTEYSGALKTAERRIADSGAEAMVVSLGVDTYEGDPISHFRLTGEDYRRLGARIADLALPTVFVLEGGYDVENLGTNVATVLEGFVG